MRVAGGLLVEGEEFPEFSEGEVALHVLLLVHHTAAQGFLVGLPLEDLLLDRPGLSAHKHTSQNMETKRTRLSEAPVLLRHIHYEILNCLDKLNQEEKSYLYYVKIWLYIAKRKQALSVQCVTPGHVLQTKRGQHLYYWVHTIEINQLCNKKPTTY